MKSRILTCVIAMTLFATSALPVQLAAQHTRFKLVDIGTLGGPTSYESVNGPGNQILNDAGIVSSFADTSTPDPRASTPNLCYNPDCFLSHAFRWKNGVLTDLGALPSVNSSAAGAINARGWSVGQSQNGLALPLTGFPEIQAVLWTDNQVIDLGTLGGNGSLAVYVNDGGQVVGATANAIPDPFSLFGNIFGETQTRTFLWEKGVMRDLGTLGGPDATPASGCVNERSGLVAGVSYTNSTPNASTGVPTEAPFLWNNGIMTNLGTLGGVFGYAQCANNRGQVIGQSSLAENPGACFTGQPGCHSFFWDRGSLTDLGTLGGTFSIPIWLNNDGDVVGGATTPNDELFHAALWRNRSITDLGALRGDCFSVAEAVNSKRQIVGQSFNCESSALRAILWDKGSLFDLNTLIPANSTLRLIDAVNINNRGEILSLGLPPGVQFSDFGGHLALLIPCGNDDEGCKGNADATTAATQSNPAIVARTPAARMLGGTTPSQMLAAWRARMARRYHIPGPTAPKE